MKTQVTARQIYINPTLKEGYPTLKEGYPTLKEGYRSVKVKDRISREIHLKIKLHPPKNGGDSITNWRGIILLMEEILHHLTCMKPCKEWDIYHINWCRISSINSIICCLFKEKSGFPKKLHKFADLPGWNSCGEISFVQLLSNDAGSAFFEGRQHSKGRFGFIGLKLQEFENLFRKLQVL